MESLEEEFKSKLKNVGIPLKTYLDGLSDTDRASWETYGMDPRMSNLSMVEIARKWGVAATKDNIAAWRSSLGFTR